MIILYLIALLVTHQVSPFTLPTIPLSIGSRAMDQLKEIDIPQHIEQGNQPDTPYVRNAFTLPILIDHTVVRDEIHSTDFDQTVASGQAMCTISKDGRYRIVDDIELDPVNDGTIGILINASNVIIDFDSHIISQKRSSTKSFDAVATTTGLSSVAFTNGGIARINGNGITVDSASGVVMNTMVINGCSRYGVKLVNANNFISESLVFVNANGNHPDATDGAVGLYAQNCRNIRILDSFFNSCVAAQPNRNSCGLLINGCTSVRLENCAAAANKGAHSYGMRLVNTQACVMKDCAVAGNESTAGVCYGFSFEGCSGISMKDVFSGSLVSAIGSCAGINLYQSTGSDLINVLTKNHTADATGSDCYGFKCTLSNNNRFINCHAIAHKSTNSTAYGFYLYGCQSNSFLYCEAQGNNASTSLKDGYGFYASSGGGNAFNKCRGSGNKGGTSLSSIAAGFALRNGESYSGITECIASGSSTVGEAYGIMLGHTGDTGTVSYCTVDDNKLLYNIGSKKYGYRDFAPYTTTVFTRNVSYGHGPTTPSISEQLTLSNSMNFMFTHTGNQYPGYTIKECSIGTLTTITSGEPLMNLSIILQP